MASHPRATQQISTSETALATAVAGQAARVLIVDVDRDASALLEELLSHEGFECETCGSAERARATLARQTFDVVIADLSVPGMAGLELLDEGRHKYPRPAFVVASAHDDLRVGIEAMRRGASDFLLKPLQVESVVMSVERAVRSKQLELEHQKRHQDLEQIVEARTRELRSAIERAERAHDEMMEMLGAALDARDDETAGHAQRVTRYALEIGKAMNCSEPVLEEIAAGAFLHDIGKIGIPDAILLKPGPLTPQERAVMQTHVEIGYDLVRRSRFLAPAAEIVLTHHERFDGMGYPRGRKGEEIPLGGRIFAVCDTLDAMTSDRPYRKALPFAAARAEIVFESGRQFDPAVAQAFLSIPESVWQEIRRDADSQWNDANHVVPRLGLIWRRWGRRAAG